MKKRPYSAYSGYSDCSGYSDNSDECFDTDFTEGTDGGKAFGVCEGAEAGFVVGWPAGAVVVQMGRSGSSGPTGVLASNAGAVAPSLGSDGFAGRARGSTLHLDATPK
jgi:hypothetical protein